MDSVFGAGREGLSSPLRKGTPLACSLLPRRREGSDELEQKPAREDHGLITAVIERLAHVVRHLLLGLLLATTRLIFECLDALLKPRLDGSALSR